MRCANAAKAHAPVAHRPFPQAPFVPATNPSNRYQTNPRDATTHLLLHRSAFPHADPEIASELNRFPTIRAGCANANGLGWSDRIGECSTWILAYIRFVRIAWRGGSSSISHETQGRQPKALTLAHNVYMARRTINSLIFPIALFGFKPFGQTSTQFMIEWQRNKR
jgi:hypothetical protein